MKKCATAVVFCVTFASMALGQAQTPVFGSGTTNFIPKFVAPNRVGNSNIFQAPNGSLGIGTNSPLFPLHIFSTNTVPPAGQSSPVALFVETPVTVDGVVGIEGLASGGTGNVIGVIGATYSDNGVGVLGNHPGQNGGGTGVAGLTNSITGFTVGTSGTSLGTTGPGVGVFGQTWSSEGVGGLFDSVPGGDIIRGGIGQPAITVFRVDGTGTVFADGGFQPSGADFAESMSVKGDRSQYVAGDLLVIDATLKGTLSLSERPYSTLVAGIYSTKPGMLGSTRRMGEPTPNSEVPLAVVGIVPCKVTAENGPIAAGDLLVTSSIAGRAMRGTDRSRMLGAVVGKALEPLQAAEGVIRVLVTLQ